MNQLTTCLILGAVVLAGGERYKRYPYPYPAEEPLTEGSDGSFAPGARFPAQTYGPPGFTPGQPLGPSDGFPGVQELGPVPTTPIHEQIVDRPIAVVREGAPLATFNSAAPALSSDFRVSSSSGSSYRAPTSANPAFQSVSVRYSTPSRTFHTVSYRLPSSSGAFSGTGSSSSFSAPAFSGAFSPSAPSADFSSVGSSSSFSAPAPVDFSPEGSAGSSIAFSAPAPVATYVDPALSAFSPAPSTDFNAISSSSSYNTPASSVAFSPPAPSADFGAASSSAFNAPTSSAVSGTSCAGCNTPASAAFGPSTTAALFRPLSPSSTSDLFSSPAASAAFSPPAPAASAAFSPADTSASYSPPVSTSFAPSATGEPVTEYLSEF